VGSTMTNKKYCHPFFVVPFLFGPLDSGSTNFSTLFGNVTKLDYSKESFQPLELCNFDFGGPDFD